MDERLRPEQRIRNRQTFQTIFQKGICFRGSLLNLWVYEQKQKSDAPSSKFKLGIVVSRKVELRANRRNLWKRRIREVCRRHQEKIKPGLWVLIQAKKYLPMPSYQEIKDEFSKLSRRAGIWK